MRSFEVSEQRSIYVALGTEVIIEGTVKELSGAYIHVIGVREGEKCEIDYYFTVGSN